MSRKALQIIAAVMFAAGLCLAARAQANFQTARCEDHDGWNNTHHYSGGHRFTHCEQRTTKLGADGKQLEVNAINGGITVAGEDRSDIQLEARIESWADSQADADKRAQETTIQTVDNRIHADTPHDSHGQNNEAVSFRLLVPRHSSVKLDDVNGGISVASLDGAMKLTAASRCAMLRATSRAAPSTAVSTSWSTERTGAAPASSPKPPMAAPASPCPRTTPHTSRPASLTERYVSNFR